ncbi:hypothetical protein KZO01_14100 [Kurthia zopfii]|uniref:Protein of uncharacterized function (DUF2812) n=1 Tax=Kurthia zopfii TaxID=1650 RepID=A0A2U3AGM0_9BACL|nr:DUF2812 domain-containing protein [Kurthia zopfii]PWI23670.1 hypothetical protein DF281_02220 [Kurthia zopfii]TDR42644.1 uncharacterized protein DUF2812 [Kurthia zopfii]STX10519.1 Protein of uncharacterised function (DUF2812) [Kurthia zopfii]VEI06101.1 Protein of uncharacterised function (DUF2812) [Kurthia zopfii]GEK31101.1 hypothetical protein KZO01_14100 [Kurthia zopfii]
MKKKYLMSGGLAFSEQKDMDKLNKLAAKGWHVEKFAPLGYSLQKGEPTNHIYCIDYHKLNTDSEEYFELFQQSGWSHIDSQSDLHLFTAPPETTPIYTDQETKITKYENSTKSLKTISLALILLTFTAWFIHSQLASSLQTISFTIASLLTLLSIPLLLTTLASFGNKWRTENKAFKYFLSKAVPITCLILGISSLFFLYSSAWLIIVSAIIGGIAGVLILQFIIKFFLSMKNA